METEKELYFPATVYTTPMKTKKRMYKEKAQNIKKNFLDDIYGYYITTQLKENPEYYTVYNYLTKNPRRRDLVVLENNKEKIIMTYFLFRSIIEENSKCATHRISNGELYNFGNNIGYLEGVRRSRDFTKNAVDTIQTKQYHRKHPEEKEVLIYHTTNDYCMIRWKKTSKLRNVKNFSFTATAGKNGFKHIFSSTIINNPSVQNKYKDLRK